MAADLPVVYLLHGEDEIGIAQTLADLTARLGDPASASLNTTRLDGNTLAIEELRAATFALPFLTARRMVVVTNPLARLSTPEIQKKFIALLEQLPPSTALVLIEYRTLKETEWLPAWASQAGKRVFMRAYTMQHENAMPPWIQAQAQRLGGKISPAAAALLAQMIGTDTRAAGNEVFKLLTYVNFTRAVEREDVEALSTPVFHEKIFALVDALAHKDSRGASGLLRQFLEEEDPSYVMGMIVRQFRLLLLAREVIDEGGNEREIQNALRLKPFEARKINNQARGFSLPVLEGVMHSLLEIDEAIKTGKIEDEVALDGMTASFTTSFTASSTTRPT